MTTIGILHPGEMGAAVGADLVAAGHTVLWAATGRSPATVDRAVHAGLHDVTDVAALVAQSEIVLSICPPAAALEVASVARSGLGWFVDANAIAPATAHRVRDLVGERYVDGGIIGPPPTQAGTTRLYLAGPGADTVAEVFGGARLEARILDGPDVTAASALKMLYAAWTKGSAALLLAVAEAAEAEGLDAALAAEWALSQPALAERLRAAERSASQKGWRWEEEMRQIAATLLAAGQPGGFHEAAAEMFARRR